MQTRYPDSYYQERYGCTWAEFCQRLEDDARYREYREPVTAFLTRPVGIPYDNKHVYGTDILVEKREEYVTPNSRVAKRAKDVYYSAGDIVLMKEHHEYYDNRTVSHAVCNPTETTPTDLPVEDIVLMRERLLDNGYNRRIVGEQRGQVGISKLSVREQQDGKTRLEATLQPKLSIDKHGTQQMTLDLAMCAA